MKITVPTAITLDATNVAASTYSEWLVGTSYSVGNNVLVSFESDGTTPRTPHHEFEALTAGAGKYPHDNPTDWLDLGATNQYKMLDDKASNQTTRTDNIQVTLGGVGKSNTIGLFGLEGQTLQVVVKNSVPTIIYDETLSLIQTGSTSWSDYFFKEVVYIRDKVIVIPALYLNMTIELTLTNGAGLDAKIGHVAVGMAFYVGCTLHGAESGILDYSVKATDDFGDTYLLERTYAKLVTAEVFVEPGAYDSVNRAFTDIRATPVIYDFNNENTDIESFAVFGFVRRFRPLYENIGVTVCSLEIEGLT